MRLKLVHFVQTLIRSCVDHPDGCFVFVAITDINTFRGCVISEIVDISVVVDTGDQLVVTAIVDIELAFAAGDEELVEPGREDNPLWLRNAGDTVHLAVVNEIDHFHGTVAQRK